jgi:hypothetical protein
LKEVKMIIDDIGFDIPDQELSSKILKIKEQFKLIA